VDGVLASYRGLLEQTIESNVSSLSASQFEVKYPQQISLFSIAGWSETFPQFKTGSYSTREDGTISYNFGAGIMFIPSGLGYYAAGSAVLFTFGL
jgi:hypothetical protein